MQIRTVGVLGCGLMGSGIAQVCVQAGYTTLVREVSESLLQAGIGRIETFLSGGVRCKEGQGDGRGARAHAGERVRYHPR